MSLQHNLSEIKNTSAPVTFRRTPHKNPSVVRIVSESDQSCQKDRKEEDSILLSLAMSKPKAQFGVIDGVHLGNRLLFHFISCFFLLPKIV